MFGCRFPTRISCAVLGPLLGQLKTTWIRHWAGTYILGPLRQKHVGPQVPALYWHNIALMWAWFWNPDIFYYQNTIFDHYYLHFEVPHVIIIIKKRQWVYACSEYFIYCFVKNLREQGIIFIWWHHRIYTSFINGSVLWACFVIEL